MAVRALIAEDEILIAFALQSQLQTHGYEVVGVATSGTEAVLMCQMRQPDVVFMDIRMPGMDGITATRKLMETSPRPTIIVTGNVALRLEAERAGAMEYAVKPVLTHQLPRLIEAAQARFARYQAVLADEGTAEAALRAWPRVQAVVRQAVSRNGVSEEAAFAHLQDAARAHQRSLREEAEAAQGMTLPQEPPSARSKSSGEDRREG